MRLKNLKVLNLCFFLLYDIVNKILNFPFVPFSSFSISVGSLASYWKAFNLWPIYDFIVTKFFITNCLIFFK
jgi:hypothetical protein